LSTITQPQTEKEFFMNPKIMGALGGLALLIVLLYPGGSSKKVERLYNEAEAMFSQSDYEGSIAKYTEALEESTKWGVKTEVIDKDFNTLANYKIAVCYSKLGEEQDDVSQYETAIEYIEKVHPIATVPKHLEGLTYLWGHVLYKQEQFELAEPKFQALIENFPNSLFVENAWYAIGQLNYQLEEYEKCRRAFKSVLDQFPNSDFKDDSQHLIAQSFLNERSYEQAYQEFDKLATDEFKNYPNLQAEAMYKAGYCLNQLARDDEAISQYTNFITKFPNAQWVTAAYFDIGAIYSKQKDYDNARVNYELALQNTPDRNLQAEIQYAIGLTYYDQGDYENAVQSYNRLLEGYPESKFIPDAKLGIADSYAKLENWVEAAPAYERAISEHEDRTDYISYATHQIGESYYHLATNRKENGETDQAKQDFENALIWYRKVIDNFSTDPVAPHSLYGAVWVLNELGRKDELETVARELIEKNRDDPEFDYFAAEVQLKFADIKFNDFKAYEESAAEYAKVWEYTDLPKFHVLKLIAKFQEGRAYYEAAQPEGYNEGDANAVFNEALLQKSIEAYQEGINKFKAEAFMEGVTQERYDDFPQRPEQVEACMMNQALAHEKLNQWGEARDLYAAIPDTSGNYQRSQMLIAQSYINEGNPSAAVAHYQSIIDSLDKDNRSLAEIKLADLLRGEERFGEAAVQYEAVVANNPEGEYADDAQYLVGLCYYKAATDDPALLEKSVTAFEQMLADYSDSPNAVEAYYGLVLAYRDIAQQEGDAAKWAKVLEIADTANEQYAGNDDTSVKKTLGHIDLVKATAIEKQGLDTEEQMGMLVASLKRIVSNDGAPEESRTRAQLKIGHLYYGANDYANALTAYQAFAQMFPNNDLVANALYQASVCYYQLAEAAADEGAKQLAYQNAANTIAQVIAKTPDVNSMISAYYTLGLAKFGLKDNQGAVDAFRKTTSYEGQTEDETRQKLISQAHSRLAELNTTLGDHAAAVQEYQYVIDHSTDDNLKGRSYFAKAYALDEHLKKYDEALLDYQNAIQLAAGALIKAQSYYRMGLIYQDKKSQPDKALEAYETLVTTYATESDTNIQAMVADGGIRKSDLYVKLGRLDDAITEAMDALEVAKTVQQKVSAQYNLGYLYFDKAQGLYSNEPGTDLKPYLDVSRQSASSYFEVAKVAGTLKKGGQINTYIQNALFQAGQIYYSLGSGNLPGDLKNALPPLKQFVEYADKGLFPASADLTQNIETSLMYTGSAYFQLGRLQTGIDGELTPAAISFYQQGADTFVSLVKRYPKAKDAPLWQYQAGESHYAYENFEKAIAEYSKVRAINPKHESVPESLYAITTCYKYLGDNAEQAGNQADKDKWYEKLYETNEVLVRDYPTSPYTADACITLGNKYYNEGLVEGIGKADVIRLYKLAIERYNQALGIPGISAESKAQAQDFVRQTSASLAADVYIATHANLDKAKLADKNMRNAALEKVIAEFQDIIKTYPNTKYANLSHVQIGEAYIVLADSDNKYWNLAVDSFDRLWSKYGEQEPSDPQVAQALTYAQGQISDILNFMQSENIPRIQRSDNE
jgi:tetratricopeptide (TPR) repeat protein